MVAPEAPVKQEAFFGELAKGFFRRAVQDNGEIFFGWKRGEFNFWFPVMEDGIISNHSGPENIYPCERIQIIDSVALGIKELKFSDERVSS